MGNVNPTGFDYFKLIIENVSLWEMMLLGILIWLARKPDILARITKFRVGDFEIELEQLKKEISDQRNEIRSLENVIENERELFGEILEGFDPQASVESLARTRDRLKAFAKGLENMDGISEYLNPEAGADQLYAAAVMFRERRPTQLIPQLIDCLDSLAQDINLRGIRLNTVWTLASALHFTVIASVRDGVKPTIPQSELSRALNVLEKLGNHPKVLADRPDNPDRGIRGPIKHATSWIMRGLQGH